MATADLAGASPRSMSAWMSPARRGLRKTWRWPTLGFSASRPAASSASPTASASAPLVAGEAARQMGELRVVAAPLAHAVQALEDAPRDAPGGVGVVVRARESAPSPRRGPRGRRPRAPPSRRGRRGARRGPRRARPPQRVRGADRGAQVRRRRPGRARARRSARARRRSMPATWLLEGQRHELGVVGVAGDGEGELRRRGARRAALPAPGHLDERADQRGDQQPGALVDGVGVGAQRRRGRARRRAAPRRRGRTATSTGCS